MLFVTPLILAIATANSAALAETGSAGVESAPSDVSATLVGDSDSAGKKKGKAAKKGKGAAQGDGAQSSKAPNSQGSSSQGSSEGNKGAERAPAREPASPTQNNGSTKQPADSSTASRTPARDSSSPSRESAARTPESGTRRTEVRTHSVQTGSGHETAGSASTERRSSGSHAAPNYRGSTGHPVQDSHAIRHNEARKDAVRHSSSVRHAAAVHHAVAVHHHAYVSHHAAWAAYHHPYYWYSAWRPGYPHYWYHGVFVYGPPVVVVGGSGGDGGGGGGGSASEARAPRRDVDRTGKFSLGIRGASYLSGFHDGSSYGDAGIGIAARYRPIDPLGIEVQWTYHDATWSQDTARIQQPLSVSAELFAFPWTRVNPYVLAGVTITDRNLDQPLIGGNFQTEEALWGPHGGVGIEFGLGKSASLNLDARFIGYVNKPVDDPARAGAVQANAGLNFYF